MEERKRWLLEQPVAVLVAHAQECGVDISGCTEKPELVQHILDGEPTQFGGWRESDDIPSEGRAQLALDPSRSTRRQHTAELRADAELARRLQAEEDRRARQPPASGSIGPRLRSSQGEGRGEASNGSIQQLLELLIAGSIARESSSQGGHNRSSEDGSEFLRQRLAGLEQSPRPGSEQGHTMQRLAQLLSSTEGAHNNLAGMQVLADLLSTLMPNSGVEQDIVDARTGTVTFNEVESPTSTSQMEERKCMVCLEEFQGGENLRILPCLHRYHRSCVDRWLKENRHCPVCKHDITA